MRPLTHAASTILLPLPLRSGKAHMAEYLFQNETTELLADLIANHEKDAFMLRALLWEVENTAA